jgi:PEP-CTERM motif
MSVKQWAQAALVAVLIASPATAGPSPMIVPSAGGTITGTIIVDSTGAPGLHVGDTVTGSYTYNPTVAQMSGPSLINPFSSFSLTIGSRTFTQADFAQFTLTGRIANQSNATADSLTFLFDQSTLNPFLGLPTTDPDGIHVANAPANLFKEEYLVNGPSTGIGVAPPILFEIDFVATPNAAVVPEPTGLTLAGLAAVGLALRARRRRAA